MTNKIYLNRLIEKNITESMLTNGCVVIEGPKWCGKSTTAVRFSNTVIKLQNPSIYRQYKILADIGDQNLLSGIKPLLFDEWQKIPELWDYIRYEIDEQGKKGLFILTGSAKPIEDKGRHTGIGRIKKLSMRTMSLWESLESSGEVSLNTLFSKNNTITGRNKYELIDIAHLLCRGGFPSSIIEKDKNLSLNYVNDYVKTLIEIDITEVDGISRNSNRARSILKSYARNISSSATFTTILGDVQANHQVEDVRTIESYINGFTKLFVIEDTESWNPKIRSKSTIRKTNTRHFMDPSIATSVLKVGPKDLINDLNTFGLLFENLVIRDLKIYAETLNGKVYNYHDSTGLEADAIIHLNDGRYGLVEIKLGGEKLIDEGAKNLIKLDNKIDHDKMNKPAFLAIITATEKFAYKRNDGVFVIPIGCLKP